MNVRSKLNLQLQPALVLLAGVLTTVGVSGCEVPTPPPGAAAENAPPEPRYVKKDSKDEKKLKEALEKTRASAAVAPPSQDAAADGADGDARSIVTSRANEPLGFVTTPINAYFSAGEQINHLQILDGLKKFRALKGRRPKDFAEVEEQVLKPRGIRLPPLKIGEIYIYDPDEGPDGDILIRSTKP
jgi:hypothetical protein